jgi:hypothetical protein
LKFFSVIPLCRKSNEPLQAPCGVRRAAMFLWPEVGKSIRNFTTVSFHETFRILKMSNPQDSLQAVTRYTGWHTVFIHSIFEI